MKPTSDIVLITGSNGRIGSAVTKRLSERFDNVVGFDREAPAPPPPDCVRIPVDIASDESVQEGLRILREHHGTRIATVIHLAAYFDFLGEPSPKYEQITVEGTRRLLRGLRQGFEVQQFIFSSTMLVHRPAELGQFINEDWPLGPTWAYPESKVRTEALIRAERGGIPAVILRLAGVYDDVCHSPPLAHQIQRIYERQLASHLYSGPTSHGQSFLHLDDLVDAIERVVDGRAKLPGESVILLGEPEALSYDELQHTFGRLIHGESWETHDVPGPIAKVGAWLQDKMPGQDSFIKPWMIDRANDHYALDISRARTLLDWQPVRSLRQTLPKMVAALKADPPGWYREHGLELPSSLPETPAASVSTMAAQSDHASHSVQAPGTPAASMASPSARVASGGVAYTCAMHDGVCQSSPGNCPRCGMALEPAAAAPTQATEYTCPMHPEVVRSEPGSCPKCGMTLVPRGAPIEAAAGHPDMMVEDHRKMLWPHYLNLMLGAWLLTSPFTLGYLSGFVPDANQLRVMTERGLPSFELRNLAMTWSDVISGVLVMVFGALSANASRRYPWAQWANAFVGVWLLFAPLVFWTPLPEAYANGTLIGALVIAFSVLIPMMPGMSMAGMMGGPDVPPGWAYTPSSWLQRMPMGVLALIGFLISRILGAYQLGHIDTVWEPFFAGSGGMNGTETIITSDVSKAWPIADGALGGIVYMAELAMIWMGGKTRWRTMPWMVLALAVLILPLGVVSIYFIIIQPIVIGTWCTLCLIAGFAMAMMIPYALNEFVAMGQFMVDARRKGKPFWRTFWTGDAMEGGSADTSKGLIGTTREKIAEATRGVTYPATLLLSIAIGVWLTFTRLAFDSSSTMADSDHLVGALVVTFSIMALAEVARSVRFINIAFGAWLIVAPWVLDGVDSPLAVWNSVICGALLIALALPRGPVRDSYAGWDRFVVWPMPNGMHAKRRGMLFKPAEPLLTPEKVIVVTGASSGVGRAVARAFGARHAKVALVARNIDALTVAAEEIRRAGGDALVLPTDVADADAVERAAAAVEEHWGRIDIWINVAMVTVLAPVRDTTAAEYRRVTEVTYLGYVHGTLAALRRMLPRDEGTIVQVGSALAYRSIPLQSAYCAAKAAVRGFTDSLRSELLHDASHVRLTHVHLPAVNTPQAERQRNKMPKQQQPVPPLFSPETIAEAILWAAEHAPREMLVGGPTLKGVWAQKFIPGFLDRYLAKAAWEPQFVDKPNDQQQDILFETMPGDPGAHGPYRDAERGPDLQLRLRTRFSSFSALSAPSDPQAT